MRLSVSIFGGLASLEKPATLDLVGVPCAAKNLLTTGSFFFQIGLVWARLLPPKYTKDTQQ
jgi:hypothetical protein